MKGTKFILLGGSPRNWNGFMAKPLTPEVREITATHFAFAARKSNGTVVTWGASRKGGDSSAVRDQLTCVEQVRATQFAFAAIKEDRVVQQLLEPDLGPLQTFCLNDRSAFLRFRLKVSVSVEVCRGHQFDSRFFFAWVRGVAGLRHLSSLPVAMFPAVNPLPVRKPAEPKRNQYDCLARAPMSKGRPRYRTNVFLLRMFKQGEKTTSQDGTVVTWGLPHSGGDCSQVQEQLTHVREIQGTLDAFAATRSNGTVVTWGDPKNGGDSSQVREQLTLVKQIQATGRAFAAIKEDGRVVTWGDPADGGDSSQVQQQLTQVDL